MTKLIGAGLVIALLGLVLTLGWFFVPPRVWLDDPGLVPMPEVLLGWWAMLVGAGLIVLGLLRGRRRPR